MRKLSISSQIVILFILILLMSALSFTTITLSRIHYIAEEETYSRLVTYSTLFNSNNLGTSDDIVDFRDMEVAFVKYEESEFVFSQDIKSYINEADFNRILEIVDSNLSKVYITNKITNYNNETIYFVVTIMDNGSYSILLTNSLYVTNLVKNVSMQIIIVFIVIILLSILVIAAWGNQLVKRLHRIQEHLLNLPKNSYEQEYFDDGLDEVGELSKAVERMREEIKYNEQTKQEMLQNISHDFKTPIAVIKSYAEAQLDGMADDDSSEIIISQAEILKHKVNRLLQYNSLEYLKKDKEFEDVNMKEVIINTIKKYKFQTSLQIILDLDDNVFFKGYKENYYTVIDNIIDNAKRYAKTKIKVVLKKNRLRIYNDGEHIDEQFLQSAFKPYEKGSKGEFGLGMSIVKKTVEFFGMELIVKNEPIGVSFIITK